MNVNLDGNTLVNGYFSGIGEELTQLDADNITSGTSTVAVGGTGQNSLAVGSLLIGNGTNPITALTPGVNISTALALVGNAPNGFPILNSSGQLIDSNFPNSGKLIYVSISQGTATRTGISQYSKNYPFTTLTDAQSAATSGDTIVAIDGTFTDKNLGKNGVNWLFLPGATINATAVTANDSIFIDGTGGYTYSVAGYGQTFIMGGGVSIYHIYAQYASNISILNINLELAPSSSNTGTCDGINNTGSANISVTGNIFGVPSGSSSNAMTGLVNSGTGTITLIGNIFCGTSATSFLICFGVTNSSSGTVNIVGNIAAFASFDVMGISNSGTGTISVSGNVACSGGTKGGAALSNSSTGTITVGTFTDGSSISSVNSNTHILSPVPKVQTLVGPSSGFSQGLTYGPQDTILYITPAATLASGTITLPADNNTRIGQLVTICSSQTITSLTVSVASGTVYGGTTTIANPGSISFKKLAANTWTML